jgi:hypothetical protein
MTSAASFLTCPSFTGACVAFAAQVTVISKQADKDVATKVSFNYKAWLEEQATKGQCNYNGTVSTFDRPAAAAQCAAAQAYAAFLQLLGAGLWHALSVSLCMAGARVVCQ